MDRREEQAAGALVAAREKAAPPLERKGKERGTKAAWDPREVDRPGGRGKEGRGKEAFGPEKIRWAAEHGAVAPGKAENLRLRKKGRARCASRGWERGLRIRESAWRRAEMGGRAKAMGRRASLDLAGLRGMAAAAGLETSTWLDNL